MKNIDYLFIQYSRQSNFIKFVCPFYLYIYFNNDHYNYIVHTVQNICVFLYDTVIEMNKLI